MGYQTPQSSASVWSLARSQHWAVARGQLLELGLSAQAIKHRIAKGRLRPVRRGVYAVGPADLSKYGDWMAAVLSCGPEAVLSHESAAALWRIRGESETGMEVSVPYQVDRRQPGIVVHRRRRLAATDVTRHRNIPLTSPIRTLIDLATRLPTRRLETAVNEADKLDLVDPETLRSAVEERSGQPGVTKLRKLLDRQTFRLTDSELERRFPPRPQSRPATAADPAALPPSRRATAGGTRSTRRPG